MLQHEHEHGVWALFLRLQAALNRQTKRKEKHDLDASSGTGTGMEKDVASAGPTIATTSSNSFACRKPTHGGFSKRTPSSFRHFHIILARSGKTIPIVATMQVTRSTGV